MSRMDTERWIPVSQIFIYTEEEDPAHNRRQDTMYITGT